MKDEHANRFSRPGIKSPVRGFRGETGSSLKPLQRWGIIGVDAAPDDVNLHCGVSWEHGARYPGNLERCPKACNRALSTSISTTSYLPVRWLKWNHPRYRRPSPESLTSTVAPDLVTYANFVYLAPVHADLPSNTMAIYGNGQDKDLTELVPGILNQLGPDSLASLRKLAESYQNLTARQAAEKKEGGAEGAEDEGDDVPDLVENFEEVEEADAKKDEAKLEELA